MIRAITTGCLAVFLLVSSAAAQSTLISVSTRRDHIFDPTRNALYITTNNGLVQRYDLATNALLTPWTVGTSLFGVDITPDASALYAGDSVSGVLRKVALPSGTVSSLNYTLDSGETHSFDVAIGANGKGLITTNFGGSGWVPIRELNTATDTLTQRTDAPGSFGFNGEVRNRTMLNRSPDRNYILVTESDSSDGPMFGYNNISDTFTGNTSRGYSLTQVASSVNRSRQIIALESGSDLHILDPSFAFQRALTGMDGGNIFSPTRDVLYAVSSSADQLVAFETANFTELFRLNVGENVAASSAFDAGVMSISPSGDRLFLSTPAGVRMFVVPEPASLAMIAAAPLLLVRRRRLRRCHR